ncbi:MAG: exodeoxyribonuclease VII small subunit [Desulfatibacillaceae bacterium]
MAKMPFETAMKKLEKIVQEMESGDLELEAALERFEEGMRLSRYLNDKLDEVEKKVTLLAKNEDGELTEKPFTPESD